MSSKSTFRSDSSSGTEELVCDELLTLELLEEDVMDELLDVLEGTELDIEVDGFVDDKRLLSSEG